MRVSLALVLLIIAQLAMAAPKFPELTGRVVDNANLLTTQQEASLTRLLAAEEASDSNQLVVVTLKSLQGYNIDVYGYQLGRHWGIGQKGKDNGVLLIVAPNEHKVRIEVGYGLEGVLTDALSSIIIRRDIVPAFKQGQFYKGIKAGVGSIIKATHGEYKAEPNQGKSQQSGPGRIIGMLISLLFIGFIFSGRGGIFALPLLMGGMGRGFGGGGLGGGGFGGFGGGGGGFGGGGASGGW